MMEIDPSIAQPEDLTKRILLSKSYDLRLIVTKNEGSPRETGQALLFGLLGNSLIWWI